MRRQPKPFSLGLLSLLTAAVIASLHFALSRGPTVKDASDLSVISGHLDAYSFWRGRHSHQYQIRLSEFRAIFELPAKDFSKASFESDVHKGDALSISIPKVSEIRLSVGERVPAFSVRTRTTTYLDENDAIQSYNSRILLWMAAVFFLGGVALIIWDRLKPKQRPPLKYLE
jgi:hypothetical protein